MSAKKLSVIIALLYLLAPLAVRAADYTLEIPLPGADASISKISNPAQYISYLFVFGLSLIGFIAVGTIVVGGVMYMLGAGNPGKTGKAKEIIVAALSGVVLLLCAYLILATIDPSLTDLTPPDLDKYNVSALAQQYDLSPAFISGKRASQIQADIQAGILTGAGKTALCPKLPCDTQTIQNHTLLTGAASSYQNVGNDIETACAANGLNCATQLTSTVDGDHLSACHKPGNSQSGTCGDFIIYANDANCKGNIKGCSPDIQKKYIDIAANAINNSPYVTKCLNEYVVKTDLSTGGHFHCGFAM